MRPDTLIIVAEGKTDPLIIRVLLGKEWTENIRFFASQGRISLATLARNLLVHEGGPLLVVMDIATNEFRYQDALLAQMMQVLSFVGAPGTFQVFAFTPEIEVVFFEAPDALQGALGIVLPAGVVEEGRVKPTVVLHRLLEEAHISNTEALIEKLDEEAIESLRRGKQATALREKARAFWRVESGAGS